MAFCTNCGAQLDGHYCSNCGTAAGASSAPQASSRAPGIDENLAAALCYVPIVGLIFLFLDPYRRSREVRFHAWQSLLFFAACVAIRIGMGLIWLMLRVMPFGIYRLWGVFWGMASLAMLAGFIIMAGYAYQRRHVRLPIIGPIAESQAG
jgi:uncharacterized membrane protein